MIPSAKLTTYLNQLLQISLFEETAMNGLQIQGRKKVQKVAFAVDGVMDSFEQAAQWGADYLIVHHGIFWGRPFPIRGADYRRIKCLIENGIALYAVHLPLDAHIELGHAAQLLKKLEPECQLEPFGRYGETTIGAMCQIRETTSKEFVNRLVTLFGDEAKTLLFGGEKVKTIACVTGQGADFSRLKEAQIRNVDFYISGETSHPTYHYCKEQKQNLALCGHYLTETFGMMALMDHVKKQFDVEAAFFDLPTGF